MVTGPTLVGKDVTPVANAFKYLCPSRNVLARLGERWAMLLLVRLKDEPMRFGELRREVEGITQKMLTQSLRRLERDGLITRRTVSEKPLAVEYSLTKRAREVVPTIISLKKWAEANWRGIQDSNRIFDEESRAGRARDA
jgi:DNA-binding HxlR family transcriptional regulator